MKYVGIITLAVILFGCNAKQAQHNKKPNIIIVFTDDQGYQDLGCYGSPKIKTPNIDQMASEGLRYTNFYVASSVCSASRAALLTGKLPKNNGVPGVFWPDQKGMDSSNVTIAEVLKKERYRTACFGKWHLGDQTGTLPIHQGFDEYYGIPYSNDMRIGVSHKFADNVKFNEGYTLEQAKADQLLVLEDKKAGKQPWKQGKSNFVPLFEGDKIVEYPAEQSSLTKRYFNKAIEFIKQSDDEPFFIYLTPAMPHIPLFASEQFSGKSERGLYGDVIEEIDYHMGQLLNHLKTSGLDKNTLVIYASDNGPWLDMKKAGGSAEPLRGGKFSNYEGGVRVPGIFWFPGQIKENIVSNHIARTIDLLPTIASLVQSDVTELGIDGTILPEIVGQDNAYKETNLYSKGKEVCGIRVGDWKYMATSGKKWAKKEDGPELFNLKDDVGEENNLHESNPEKVEELKKLLEEHK
ncbi:sulfatase [Bacteroidales bacterium]|nr:sulfatase [Bacteroidales bacterium]